MRPNWIKVFLAVAVLWAAIAGATALVRKYRATPENISAFISANKLDGKSPAERAKVIETVASQVNRLEYDQRQELNKQRRIEPFWNSMSIAEKSRYLDLVLPTGFKQMHENFNKMERGKRQRLVEKAARELREKEGELAPGLDPALLKKLVDQGLKSFYSDATIDAKMDAMPFLEALEQTVKWSR